MTDDMANDTSVTGPRRPETIRCTLCDTADGEYSSFVATTDDSHDVSGIEFLNYEIAKRYRGATVEITLKEDGKSEGEKWLDGCNLRDGYWSDARVIANLIDRLVAVEKKIGEKG